MKHKTEIVVDVDRTNVWRMFEDPNSMTKWQPTLMSFTHKSGTPGQPDAMSELVYEEKGCKMVMLKTVTARHELDFLGGTYESKWGTVVIFNNFEETDDGKTS